MQDTMFGTYGDTAQAAYHIARVGSCPRRDKAAYLTADAFYPKDPDARYKTNKGNQSHVVFGDDRDWNLTSISSEKYRGVPQETSRAPIVEGFSKMSPKQIQRVYTTAIDRLGKSAVAQLTQVVIDKVIQRPGGTFALRGAFKFYDKAGDGVLSPDQFHAALDSFGVQFDEEQLIALFSLHDPKLQGLVDYFLFMQTVLADFMSCATPAKPREREHVLPVPESPMSSLSFTDARKASVERVREMFNRCDITRIGRIETRRLRFLLDQLGFRTHTDKLTWAIDSLDPEGSGSVSWEKFHGWWVGVCSMKGESSPQRGQSLTPTPQFPRKVDKYRSPTMLIPDKARFQQPPPRVSMDPRAYMPLGRLNSPLQPHRGGMPISNLEVDSRQAARDCTRALESRGNQRVRTGFRTTGHDLSCGEHLLS